MKIEQLTKQIKRDSLTMIYNAGSGHPGGCLSCAGILAQLFGYVMRPNDVFILSKGHAAPALYSALARTNRADNVDLAKFRKAFTKLQGHPSVVDFPEVQASTGSLGQGLSQAVGVALAKKHKQEDGIVYVLIGDGEIQEGICWESFMCASHYNLDNLVCIMDHNELQSDARNEEIIVIEPLRAKILAFGWEYHWVHTKDSMYQSQNDSYYWEHLNIFGEEGFDKPLFVDVCTVKGDGVSFMENNPEWHGSRGLTIEEYGQAMLELI